MKLEVNQDTVDAKNDDASVVRDAMAAKTAPEAPALHATKSKKRLLVILAVVVLGAGLAGVAYALLHKDVPDKTNNTVSCAPKTDTVLVQEANTALNENATENLLGVDAKIKNIDCYEQNSTYAYITLAAALRISDVAGASAALKALEKAYNDEQGYDKGLTQTPDSLENLRRQVKTLEASVQSLKQYAPLPVPENEGMDE